MDIDIDGKKIKWKGSYLNDSDVGYDPEWVSYIPIDSPGPREPIRPKNEK